MEILHLTLLILSLLIILIRQKKQSSSDTKNPSGNYIVALQYYFGDIVYKLFSKYKLNLPIEIENENNERYLVNSEYSVGKWLRDLITCVYCLSFWVLVIVLFAFVRTDILHYAQIVFMIKLYLDFLKILVDWLSSF